MRFHGITDAGFTRIAAVQRKGEFLAEPPIPSGEKFLGVVEFPGFHTTGSMDIAASYAVSRVGQSFTQEDASGEYFVTDYPVVVALDMSSYSPQTDYDAEKTVWEVLEVHLGELINEGLTVESSDEQILEALSDFLQFSEDYNEDLNYEDPYELIGEQLFSHFRAPLWSFEDDPEFPYLLRQYMQTGEFPADRLMESADQYRYTEDVGEDRILAVHYVQPVAQEMDSEAVAEAGGSEALGARWPGFDVPWQDDLMGGYYGFTSELVWGSEEGFQPEFQQTTMPWVAPSSGQVEYHGTTYKRLLDAAPSLADQLPEPPSPPYQGGV